LCACLNFISDKYLPLTAFLGVGRPGLENIDKFPLECTSPPLLLPNFLPIFLIKFSKNPKIAKNNENPKNISIFAN
jgi:hypothetical protein